MPQVLSTLLYILLFIFCLSILIMIHELGHFTAAKIFKVYVQEYSIGFGPALIHKKRKDGETYFSLRTIPFGGYVSMYGEGVELEDGVQVDESRSLEGIKKWKRAIILVAGVTMNALLALTVFFIYNVSFSETVCYYNQVTITENSIAYQSGLRSQDIIAMDKYVLDNEQAYQGNYHLIDDKSIVTLSDDRTISAFTFIDLGNVTSYKAESISLNNLITLFASKEVDGVTLPDFEQKIGVGKTFSTLTLNITTMKYDEQDKEKIIYTPHSMVVKKASEDSLENIGYSLFLYTQKPLPFFKALGQSFVDFGTSSTLIIRAFGSMFTKETWSQMGGIVAIGFQTTSILQNFGFGRFLYVWGVISVNLAIVNLFPFPGLDGWQLLVLAVEGIAHRKISNKVKNIVSIIGIGLLFAFMIVLVVKDVITYIL